LLALKSVGFDTADHIFLDQPLMAHPELRRVAPRLIYRPTDSYFDRIASSRERRFVEIADGVAATSHSVLEKLGLHRDKPAIVIENGVEYDRFASAEPAQRSGLVYVGALDYRFDWAVIQTLASELPDQVFDLAGPVTVGIPPLPSNVRMLGPVKYADVPQLLARHRIGLLPFNDAPTNRGRSPMKLFEYLASGLYVAASSSPSHIQRDLPGVLHFADRNRAVDSVKQLLAETTPNAAGADQASRHGWAAKAKALETFAQSLRSCHQIPNSGYTQAGPI
jgi:glycosyltransferase involved in cell wall biosynthesis